jgi:hypothetical protein
MTAPAAPVVDPSILHAPPARNGPQPHRDDPPSSTSFVSAGTARPPQRRHTIALPRHVAEKTHDDHWMAVRSLAVSVTGEPKLVA